MENTAKNTHRAAWHIVHKRARGFFSCVVLLAGCSAIFAACHEKATGDTARAEAKKDSVKRPHTNIRVNRHYDDKGKEIGFDSTYTSSIPT